MKESQYLALFYTANFCSSIHHMSSREFSLISAYFQALFSTEDCYKSLVIHVFGSIEIPAKHFNLYVQAVVSCSLTTLLQDNVYEPSHLVYMHNASWLQLLCWAAFK